MSELELESCVGDVRQPARPGLPTYALISSWGSEMITPEQLAGWQRDIQRVSPYHVEVAAYHDGPPTICLVRNGCTMSSTALCEWMSAAVIIEHLPVLLAEVTGLQTQHDADAAFIKDAKAAVSELEDENADLRAALEEARLELARWRAAGAGG